MKKILITGANSYIGTSFEKYIKDNYSDEYTVDTVDMIDGSWKQKDFSGYDSVFHVAGIAHQKETAENAQLYYKVNRNLAIEAAEKCKAEGVRQFVFLSSMSVYGKDVGIITKSTIPEPISNYGKSKLEAESKIQELQSDNFCVAVLRPPMVYGKGCKGNFQSVVKIVSKFPVFPRINNKRSMIYVNHLSSFVEMCIRENLEGVFFPQNQEYMNTSNMAEWIAQQKGRNVFFSNILGVIVKTAVNMITPARKAFGNLIYEDTEDFDFCYCKEELQDTVRKSV